MKIAPSALELRLHRLFPETAAATADRVGMLSDVQREAIWQHLRSMHHELAWVGEDALEAHVAEAWQPVLERRQDAVRLFLDRDGGRVLMAKAPVAAEA